MAITAADRATLQGDKAAVPAARPVNWLVRWLPACSRAAAVPSQRLRTTTAASQPSRHNLAALLVPSWEGLLICLAATTKVTRYVQTTPSYSDPQACMLTSIKSQNYGYSNTGNNSGGYSGQAPPASYQPSGASTPAYSSASTGQHATSQHGSAPSYGAQQQHQQPQQHGTQSFPPPPSGQHGGSSYSSPPPNSQPHVPSYGSHPQAQAPGYGHHSPAQGQHYCRHSTKWPYLTAPLLTKSAAHQPPYNTSPPGQHQQYNGGSHQQYPPPQSTYNPQYGSAPPPPGAYPGPPTYAGGNQHAPPVPSGSHPHHGQQPSQGGYPGNW